MKTENLDLLQAHIGGLTKLKSNFPKEKIKPITNLCGEILKDIDDKTSDEENQIRISNFEETLDSISENKLSFAHEIQVGHLTNVAKSILDFANEFK